jgi:hypothetical protein
MGLESKIVQEEAQAKSENVVDREKVRFRILIRVFFGKI